MNIKVFIVLTLAVLGLASFAAADEDYTDDAELIDLDGDDRGHRELAASWWERLKESNPDVNLKQCARRQGPPSTGDKCAKKPKTCFFGTQDCPSVGPHPMSKCTCDGKKPNNGKWTCVPEPCPVETTARTEEETAGKAGAFFYSKPNQAFDVKMNLLTPKVLEGYDNITELTVDLIQVVRFYINWIIDEQTQYIDLYNAPTRSPGQYDMPAPTSALLPGRVPPGASPTASQTDDFSTNNQEEGIDESDLVKSDGVYLYAAYGDVLVIWDATTGESVANYTLPPIYDIPPTAAPVAPPVNEHVIDENIYQPKPVIRGLSLAAERLVLYIQGYGEKIRSTRTYASAFSNAYDTRVIILDTSTLPSSIDIVSQEDIQGSFREARSIGSDVHVVTSSDIDFFPVTWPLYLWNVEYRGFNSTEYKEKAVSIAEPLIDDFVATLLKEILLNGKAPAIPKISLWQSDLGNSTNIVDQLFSGGVIHAYVQLTSFSVQDLTGNAILSTAGVFTPSSWGYTYAVDGDLVFTMQGWNWSPW